MEFFRTEPGIVPQPNFGAFVISLDFELHWGVRDHQSTTGEYRQKLLGARQIVPRMLDLFRRYDIAGTWATVGFLFAPSKKDIDKFQPTLRPVYVNTRLDPYRENIGIAEEDDPFHYASSLLDWIQKCPRQEIATHTFSHYFCLEPGQTFETFASDLRSAVAIAASRGIQLRSMVFPRNQINPDYFQALLEFGIRSYRGCQHGWMHRAVPRKPVTRHARLARLLDSYMGFSGYGTINWSDIPEASGLCNVRASQFLRPIRPNWTRLETIRLKHITAGIEKAARNHEIYHLWFHPHNFGTNAEENFAAFEIILNTVASCRGRFGMRALSMSEIAEIVRPQHFAPAQKPVSAEVVGQINPS